MQTFKLTLEYDGTKFSGWQEQINARTVQGDLKQAAREVLHAEPEIQGAGRTDAGVHALGQVAHLKLRGKAAGMRPEEMLERLNDKLSSGIAIVGLEEVPARFHARHDARSRAYLYQISTRKTALAKRYVWWVKQHLDVEQMKQAAALLPGRHDFAAFRALDPSKPDDSTIVVVDSAEIDIDQNLILFRIEASHYLWKMVRRIVGVLVKIGKGEVSVEEFRALLKGQSAGKLDIAAWTAPASGLFLEGIRY